MSTEIDEIREILREVALAQKESREEFKEIAARFRENDKLFKKNEERFKKNEERFKENEERFKETDRKWNETAAHFKETGERIKGAYSLFETQWGKLIETLVDGDLVGILRSRGVHVTQTSRRRKGHKNGENYEFDIIAHNGDEIVIVEVKTTLRVSHVKKFIRQLEQVHEYMTEYKGYKVYGAVAFLDEADSSSVYAEKQKLFVIKATGDSAAVINAPDFKPRVF